MISSLGTNSVIEIVGLTRPADTIENQKSWSTGVKYSNVYAYIEQMDAKNTMIFNGDASSKMFTMLAHGIFQISIGDKVKDNHGREFTVQGVQAFVGDVDVPDHVEVVMVQKYPA